MLEIPKSAKYYYNLWLSLFPETWDEEEDNMNRFYMFVHVLLSNAKKERSRNWFKQRLKEDCKGKLNNRMLEKYSDLYQHLKSFKNVHKSKWARLIAKDIHEKNMDEARKKYS